MGRVICFDKRGTGISDPVPLGAIPTIERWMDDITTVIDAVGSTRIVPFGHGDGGPIAMLFAATYPQRTEALVLGDTFARIRAAADYAIGLSEAAAEAKATLLYRSWGRADQLRRATPDTRMHRPPPGGRASSGSHSARALSRPCTPSAISTSTSAPYSGRSERRRSCSIVVTTLWIPFAFGRYSGEHIPGATFVELAWRGAPLLQGRRPVGGATVRHRQA
jgi:pimeloyl-ACP methyl ester carboxylesterase